MFEKEADLHASIMAWNEEEDTWETIAERAYKAGAEFGYNKANEWHYVKDGDLPKESISVLVSLENKRLMECLYIPEEGFRDPVFSEWFSPVAWIEKEKIFPKESE